MRFLSLVEKKIICVCVCGGGGGVMTMHSSWPKNFEIQLLRERFTMMVGHALSMSTNDSLHFQSQATDVVLVVGR